MDESEKQELTYWADRYGLTDRLMEAVEPYRVRALAECGVLQSHRLDPVGGGNEEPPASR